MYLETGVLDAIAKVLKKYQGDPEVCGVGCRALKRTLNSVNGKDTLKPLFIIAFLLI